MSINIKSSKIKTYQNYTLYRSTASDVYAGQVLGTNATGVFIDTPPVDKILYYYGIKCDNGVANEAYLETPVGYYHLDDWGPFTPVVTSNITQNGTPFFQGSLKNGVITEYGGTSLMLPSIFNEIGQAKFNTWTTASGTGWSANTILIKNLGKYPAGVCLNGKLVCISPLSMSETYYYGGSASASVVAVGIHKFVNYINNLSDNSNVVEIGGYRWKLKAMTQDEFASNLANFCTSTYAGPVFRDYTLYTDTYPTYCIIPGQGTNTDMRITWTNGLPVMDAVVSSNGVSGWVFQCYFEYIGRV